MASGLPKYQPSSIIPTKKSLTSWRTALLLTPLHAESSTESSDRIYTKILEPMNPTICTSVFLRQVLNLPIHGLQNIRDT